MAVAGARDLEQRAADAARRGMDEHVIFGRRRTSSQSAYHAVRKTVGKAAACTSAPPRRDRETAGARDRDVARVAAEARDAEHLVARANASGSRRLDRAAERHDLAGELEARRDRPADVLLRATRRDPCARCSRRSSLRSRRCERRPRPALVRGPDDPRRRAGRSSPADGRPLCARERSLQQGRKLQVGPRGRLTLRVWGRGPKTQA